MSPPPPPPPPPPPSPLYRKNAVQAAKKICVVYGDNAVSERTVREWFVKFRRGEFNVEDRPRSGRPSAVDDDQIKALITNNQHITTREIAERLKVSNSTIYEHLMRLGFVSRLDVWVPHELTERNLMDRISTCDLLLKRNENDPFFKQMITGDEKWIIYNNVERKRSWSHSSEPPSTTPKANIHAQKVMLCCWWD
ncbi:histone-lysine N-methyltransferase SETMAR-like [Ooceraea biroi]|uniref:histone-lysine N-methyltransferase SETMAR-like n=1 Tax=Ooceraea biroi TaxID=2015173 RepID=UPI000F08BE76|nr:histone-lysine N-methyltransferase SETMAR-like [Ooceraea biroi]